jgi:hypothetical protein
MNMSIAVAFVLGPVRVKATLAKAEHMIDAVDSFHLHP